VTAPAPGTPPDRATDPKAAPNVEALADKVYRLLLADVRLETARRGPGTRRA
jgi:hypothetical protein